MIPPTGYFDGFHECDWEIFAAAGSVDLGIFAEVAGIAEIANTGSVAMCLACVIHWVIFQ